MGRGTIIDVYYDEENGITEMTKGTKWGVFTKSVQVNEIDADIANYWDGCAFAEAKCDIASQQAKTNAMRERFNGARHLYDVVYQSGCCDPETERRMYRQVVAAEEAYEDAKFHLDTMREAYKFYTDKVLDERRRLRKRAEDLKEQG